MEQYRNLAQVLLDYLGNCNRRNIVPLRWDLNHYTARFHEIEKKGKLEGADCLGGKAVKR